MGTGGGVKIDSTYRTNTPAVGVVERQEIYVDKDIFVKGLLQVGGSLVVKINFSFAPANIEGGDILIFLHLLVVMG